MVENAEEEEMTLNEFFREYEHLFVITGVFAALAVYLLQARESTDLINPEYVGIGIFSAFSIVVMTSVLVGIYGISEFSPGRLSEVVNLDIKWIRFSFLAVFLGLFYFIIYSIATVAISQKTAVLYFSGVVFWLIISGLAAAGLIIILYSIFESHNYGIKAGLVIEGYLFLILFMSVATTGHLSTRYGVTAGDVTDISSDPSFPENIAAALSFSTTALTLITLLFLLLSTSALINMIVTKAGGFLQKIPLGTFGDEPDEKSE